MAEKYEVDLILCDIGRSNIKNYNLRYKGHSTVVTDYITMFNVIFILPLCSLLWSPTFWLQREGLTICILFCFPKALSRSFSDVCRRHSLSFRTRCNFSVKSLAICMFLKDSDCLYDWQFLDSTTCIIYHKTVIIWHEVCTKRPLTRSQLL